jgi:RNA polymerase subunit RPABC4/transcription elongation factor Spt4
MVNSKEKACLNCKAIYVGNKCPRCGETPASDSFKGKVYIFNAEKSEIANKLKIYKEGESAIKTK